MLAFGIAWLNRAYNILEQIKNSEKPKSGTWFVFAISFILFIIVLGVVNIFP
jgi:hypothetical protein